MSENEKNETAETKPEPENRLEEMFNLVAGNPQIFGDVTGEDEAIQAATDFIAVEVASRSENKAHLKARDFSEVALSITYEGFETVEFLFRKKLSRDQRKTRQQWLGIPKEKEEEMNHEVSVMTFARLLIAEPLGDIPGWNEMTANHLLETGKTVEETLQDRFQMFFLDEKYESFIDDLNTAYVGKYYPIELYKPHSA